MMWFLGAFALVVGFVAVAWLGRRGFDARAVFLANFSALAVIALAFVAANDTRSPQPIALPSFNLPVIEGSLIGDLAANDVAVPPIDTTAEPDSAKPVVDPVDPLASIEFAPHERASQPADLQVEPSALTVATSVGKQNDAESLAVVTVARVSQEPGHDVPSASQPTGHSIVRRQSEAGPATLPAAVSALPRSRTPELAPETRVLLVDKGLKAIADERQNVVYFIDRSGSMELNEPKTGKPYFDLARSESIQIIDKLPAGSQVGVVLFDSDFKWFFPADNKNSLGSLDDWNQVKGKLHDEKTGGDTKPLPALVAALARQPDNIVLLTDGVFDVSDADFEELKAANTSQTQLVAFQIADHESPILKKLVLEFARDKDQAANLFTSLVRKAK